MHKLFSKCPMYDVAKIKDPFEVQDRIVQKMILVDVQTMD